MSVDVSSYDAVALNIPHPEDRAATFQEQRLHLADLVHAGLRIGSAAPN